MTATEIEVMYFETKGRGHKPRLRQLPKAEEGKETILPFQSLGGTDLPPSFSKLRENACLMPDP